MTRKGIVMEIRQGAALLMLPGGDFIKAPAQAGWQKGDLVSVRTQRKPRRFPAILSAAACLLVLIVASVFVTSQYHRETTTLISLDINPGMVLRLNRSHSVQAVDALNADAEQVLDALPLEGLPLGEAVDTLMSSAPMQPYLANGQFLVLTFYTSGDSAAVESTLNAMLTRLMADFPELRCSCQAVSKELFEQAAAHNMTPGKLMAILALQESDPTLATEDFLEHSIGQLLKALEDLPENSDSADTAWPWGASPASEAPSTGATGQSEDPATPSQSDTASSTASQAGSSTAPTGGTPNTGSSSSGGTSKSTSSSRSEASSSPASSSTPSGNSNTGSGGASAPPPSSSSAGHTPGSSSGSSSSTSTSNTGAPDDSSSTHSSSSGDSGGQASSSSDSHSNSSGNSDDSSSSSSSSSSSGSSSSSSKANNNGNGNSKGNTGNTGNKDNAGSGGNTGNTGLGQSKNSDSSENL